MTTRRLNESGTTPIKASPPPHGAGLCGYLTGAIPLGGQRMESTHLSALQMKHAGLEKQIQSEMSRPLPDETLVAQLKRKKLKIKEELSRLH